MANPDGQIPVNPDAVRAAEERFALMEAELQTLREQNETLMRELREQQSVAEAERLRAGRRTQAQVHDFANLTAELLAGRAVPAVNIGGPHMGVKMERPEAFDGGKHQDVDTWLFQVGEHLRMLNIPEDSRFAYAASLLRGNAAMWWRERCESGERAADWPTFCAMLRAQFRVENLARRGRDELVSVQQYARESVADFLFRFRGICLKIADLGEAEKLDRFCRASVAQCAPAGRIKRPCIISRGGNICGKSRRCPIEGPWPGLWTRMAEKQTAAQGDFCFPSKLQNAAQWIGVGCRSGDGGRFRSRTDGNRKYSEKTPQSEGNCEA